MKSPQTGKQDRPGPLEGVRLVEYGVFHAGPGAGAILADMGAEVIKIEADTGDPERYWSRVGGVDFTAPHGNSLMFDISNRNKRGIYLDVEQEKGREILHRLVEGADVFLTNLRKSTKSKMGIDYQTLSRINPMIIHANVSGYGPEGPMNDLGAFDPMGQARSGMMFVTGTSEPTLIHLGVIDQATAITASHAILTALFVRERRGFGQEVHVSIYSSALWLLYCNLMVTNLLDIDLSRVPWDRSKNSPLRNCFICKDGKWILGTNHPEEKYWPDFFEATGQTALAEDPRFADQAGRMANCPELVAIFDRVFATKTRDEWMEIFLERGLMFCSVQEVHEVATDPQALANEYMVPFEDPLYGRVMIPGYPAHFSAGRTGTRRLGPSIGEHTTEVLSEMGYSAQEIEDLRREGVIG